MRFILALPLAFLILFNSYSVTEISYALNHYGSNLFPQNPHFGAIFIFTFMILFIFTDELIYIVKWFKYKFQTKKFK